ncbi:hypothetical protein BT93_F3322 [Corymbia citriodora subsp. variegata]|nr:hypothetical protein BT93_F3322 [Corymbia citriodora subsp. variegata]
MGVQDVNCLLLIFVLFLTCICTPTSSRLMSSRHGKSNLIYSLLYLTGIVYEEAVCGMADCGMGTCREMPGAVLRYTCDCDSGWTRPWLGLPVEGTCIIPNCTINYPCGGEPPMASPSTQFPPHFNFSNPCLLVFCGDGECVASGNSHECQCHQGSANLMGRPTFPCFQPCEFLCLIPCFTSILTCHYIFRIIPKFK